MMKHSYFFAEHVRVEAIQHLSLNQYPIPRNQIFFLPHCYVNGLVAILNKEVIIVPIVIRDRGFECNGQPASSLILRQNMDCV